MRHRPIADELESISNDKLPARIHALRIGGQAVGALALGALGIGALAIGALAIGRLVIGRSRIRRLEIDDLVVARLHVTESLSAPSTPAVDNIGAKKQQSGRFNQPTTVDRAINKLFGFLVGFGLGLRHNYLLYVRGRKSGRIYSTPVDVLDRDGKRYLVAPRGYTQWVRNAIASGTISLKKGRQSEEFAVRILSDDEKPEILKSYLDRYKLTVQRYFPVPAGSPTEAFRPLTGEYPVFELIPQRCTLAVLALCRARPFNGEVLATFDPLAIRHTVPLSLKLFLLARFLSHITRSHDLHHFVKSGTCNAPSYLRYCYSFLPPFTHG